MTDRAVLTGWRWNRCNRVEPSRLQPLEEAQFTRSTAGDPLRSGPGRLCLWRPIPLHGWRCDQRSHARGALQKGLLLSRAVLPVLSMPFLDHPEGSAWTRRIGVDSQLQGSLRLPASSADWLRSDLGKHVPFSAAALTGSGRWPRDGPVQGRGLGWASGWWRGHGPLLACTSRHEPCLCSCTAPVRFRLNPV